MKTKLISIFAIVFLFCSCTQDNDNNLDSTNSNRGEVVDLTSLNRIETNNLGVLASLKSIDIEDLKKLTIFDSQEELEDYIKYVEELQKEFPDKKIYHEFNILKEHETPINLIANTEKVNTNSTRITSTNSLRYGSGYKKSSWPMPPMAWGGSGGTPFDYTNPNSTQSTGSYIPILAIRCGKYIDAIQMGWKHSSILVTTPPTLGPKFGRSNGGTLKYMQAKYIDEIRVKAGNRVDRLTFIDGDGVHVFGRSNGGTEHCYKVFNTTITGIHGASGNHLDRIGFHLWSR